MARRVHFLTLGCPEEPGRQRGHARRARGPRPRAGARSRGGRRARREHVRFIGPAKEESIDAILDLARVKAARTGGGSSSPAVSRSATPTSSRAELPEVDVFVGTGDLLRIADAVEGPAPPRPDRLPRRAARAARDADRAAGAHAAAGGRRTSRSSEGCDHQCSFCIIPKIRGRHESRAMDDLLHEAASLAAGGALELNLIAQDLTAYGRDRHDGSSLAVLLRALAVRVPDVRWLRLLYAYPSSVTDELLRGDGDGADRVLATSTCRSSTRPTACCGRCAASGAAAALRAPGRPHPLGGARRRAPVVVHRRLPGRDRGRRPGAVRVRRGDRLRSRRRLRLLARGADRGGSARGRRAGGGEARPTRAGDGDAGGGVGRARARAGRSLDRGPRRARAGGRSARRPDAGPGTRDRRRRVPPRRGEPGRSRRGDDRRRGRLRSARRRSSPSAVDSPPANP